MYMSPRYLNKAIFHKDEDETRSVSRRKLHDLFLNIQLHCPNSVKVYVTPKTLKYKCSTLDKPCNVANCPRINELDKK